MTLSICNDALIKITDQAATAFNAAERIIFYFPHNLSLDSWKELCDETYKKISKNILKLQILKKYLKH